MDKKPEGAALQSAAMLNVQSLEAATAPQAKQFFLITWTTYVERVV
jgi:hypothetical protein